MRNLDSIIYKLKQISPNILQNTVYKSRKNILADKIFNTKIENTNCICCYLRKITKFPTNGGLQRVDTWMWSYVRLSLNGAKQAIVTNIQIWGAAGPNILRDNLWGLWSGKLGGYGLSLRMTSYQGLLRLPCWWCYDSRFCANFEIGWLGSDFNVFFNPARNVLAHFRSLRGLCRLLWTLPSASKAEKTR